MLIPLKELLELDEPKVSVSITNWVPQTVEASGVISIEGKKIFLLTDCERLDGEPAKDSKWYLYSWILNDEDHPEAYLPCVHTVELLLWSPEGVVSATNPDHYHTEIQPIDYILANKLPFCEGNVVKYITRWREKGGVEDLKKAKQYIEFLINQEVNGKPR